MTTQPEALRLADWLEDQYDPTHNQEDAAAELRRLHAVNLDCVAWFDALKAERDELLAALKRAEPFIEGRMLDCEAIYDDSDDGVHYEAYATARDTFEQARAVIAKAEG